MRCVWEFPDGCRCEARAQRDMILCLSHQTVPLFRQVDNEGFKRYWLGSQAQRRKAAHVDNHGKQPVMVGAGWSAW